MTLEPMPEYLREHFRDNFLATLQANRSLEFHELDLFHWFAAETDKTWKRMEEQELHYINQQQVAGLSEINDSGILATNYYRKRMRSSHVIFLSSLLEGAMKRECDRITSALYNQLPFRLNELKGDPWIARKIFLERYGAFDIPSDVWTPIKDLLTVRNALVHH